MTSQRLVIWLAVIGPLAGLGAAQFISGSTDLSWLLIFTVCGLLIWGMGRTVIHGWEEFSTATKRAYTEERAKKT